MRRHTRNQYMKHADDQRGKFGKIISWNDTLMHCLWKLQSVRTGSFKSFRLSKTVEFFLSYLTHRQFSFSQPLLAKEVLSHISTGVFARVDEGQEGIRPRGEESSEEQVARGSRRRGSCRNGFVAATRCYCQICERKRVSHKCGSGGLPFSTCTLAVRTESERSHLSFFFASKHTRVFLLATVLVSFSWAIRQLNSP